MISNRDCVDQQLQQKLWQLFTSENNEELLLFLDYFSQVEKDVLVLLALGLSIYDICRYKGIAEVRLRQVIYIIKQNKCWEELYGAEKTANRAGTSRT